MMLVGVGSPGLPAWRSSQYAAQPSRNHASTAQLSLAMILATKSLSCSASGICTSNQIFFMRLHMPSESSSIFGSLFVARISLPFGRKLRRDSQLPRMRSEPSPPAKDFSSAEFNGGDFLELSLAATNRLPISATRSLRVSSADRLLACKKLFIAAIAAYPPSSPSTEQRRRIKVPLPFMPLPRNNRI